MGKLVRWLSVSAWWITGSTIVLLLAIWSDWRADRSIDRTRVYTVGTDNTLPYHALLPPRPGAAPEPTGIAAELMVRAAGRLVIQLRWVQTDVQSLRDHEVDLWPANTESLSHVRFRVTRSFMRHSLVLVSKEPLSAWQVAQPDFDRVLMRMRQLTSRQQSMFPRSRIIGYSERRQVLEALCRGEAPVAMLEARPLQAMLLDRPPVCAGVALHITGMLRKPEGLGFGSTPQMAPVANLLRSEVDKMLRNREADDLLRKWSYYSNADVDLLFREVSEMRERQISNGLVVLLVLLLVALSKVTCRSIAARREAIAANQAKTDFLANMSHEMRTPLNGILGLAEVLSRSGLQPTQREYLDKLRSSGSSLLQIVNDVLDLSRVASGRFELRPERTDLREVFGDLTGVFAESALAKGLDFRVDGFEALPIAVVDGLRLRQLFHNLVGNAIKFTDCGWVHVGLRIEAGPRLRMVVEDSGIGIGAEARHRLFEKFYQADSSSHRRFGGTGLGLAIVREIVEAMNGDITVESEPGQGSRFQVSIPLRDVATQRPEATVGTSGRDEAGEPIRILVVEDNAVNQLVVVSLLTGDGHVVDVAENGLRALDMLDAQAYDVVLMDCHMPVMDGFEATRQIRKREAATGRHTAIIALTASALDSERERCLRLGFDDFLSKPVQPGELRRVTRRWADQRRIESTS